MSSKSQRVVRLTTEYLTFTVMVLWLVCLGFSAGNNMSSFFNKISKKTYRLLFHTFIENDVYCPHSAVSKNLQRKCTQGLQILGNHLVLQRNISRTKNFWIRAKRRARQTAVGTTHDFGRIQPTKIVFTAERRDMRKITCVTIGTICATIYLTQPGNG